MSPNDNRLTPVQRWDWRLPAAPRTPESISPPLLQIRR
jgi:hypothetical protein